MNPITTRLLADLDAHAHRNITLVTQSRAWINQADSLEAAGDAEGAEKVRGWAGLYLDALQVEAEIEAEKN